MNKFGILSTAEIARRRFIPAIIKDKQSEIVYIASANLEERSAVCSCKISNEEETAKSKFTKEFANKIGAIYIHGFNEMLEKKDFDSVYLPLPPAYHYYWGKKALLNGKHILMEKPFCINYKQAEELVFLARSKKLVVMENYGFIYHKQINRTLEILNSGEIGKLMLVRASFGFPKRDANDFRYQKELGGGALLDCGCYTIKAANLFLGNTMSVISSSLNNMEDYNVDGFGTVTAKNKDGIVAHLSFGMNNQYECFINLWGTCGEIFLNRAFTAPAELETSIKVSLGNDIREERMVKDDQFKKIIDRFNYFKFNDQAREIEYDNILIQSQYLEDVIKRKV